MIEQDARTGCGRIGVDFGESLTVIAISGPDGDCNQVEFPGISRMYPAISGDRIVHVIPSLLQYKDDGTACIGEEVRRSMVADSPTTARWMRRYLCEQSPVQIPAGNGRKVRYEDAATGFLTGILAQVIRQYPGTDMVFSLPPDAPRDYRELLQRIALAAGAPAVSTIHEYLAAATGCGYVPVAGEPFAVITFSETEPEIAIVSLDQGVTKEETGGIRVIARTSSSTGCRAIDTWIIRDLLSKFRMLDSDPRAIRLSLQLRYEAERLREHLPVTGTETVQLTDIISGKTFSTVYTLDELNRVIAEHDIAGSLQEGICRALAGMRMRGGDGSRIKAALLLGSGCTLPAVQDIVRLQFPEAEIYTGHPLDAIARGAAIHSTVLQAENRITFSYALRYWDPSSQEHHYRFLVHHGTRYPSAGQVARIVISGAYDGQTHLGIPIYEIGGISEATLPQIELVSDSHGGVRLAGCGEDAHSRQQVVHANARSPTLLAAKPPARKGEPRFECTFSIDRERNLCLTARDLLTGTLVKLDAPIHRLK